MHVSVLLDCCLESGIDFFTGVPDSYLKGLCDELYFRYGTSGSSHIVAHNEGGAIGLCAGHYLATGHPALCYMQNSGLGNAVNPITSLMDPQVYGIPCLLIIGWRGEPGTKDEPQHVKQGAVTLSQLDLLDIPYRILSADTSDQDFRRDFTFLRHHLQNGKLAALVVRKGALVSEHHPDYGNSFTLTREKAAEIIVSSLSDTDLVVSTTGKLSREIFEIRERNHQKHDHDFLTVGSMGHASMIALEMCEQLPAFRIWCLDGDGALMMHLGAMALIGQRRPARLVHAVINNGAHETVGGMPVCCGALHPGAAAEAFGYRHRFTADSEKTLSDALVSIRSIDLDGPCFLEIRCACGARSDLGRPTTTPEANRKMLMEFITKSSQF